MGDKHSLSGVINCHKTHSCVNINMIASTISEELYLWFVIYLTHLPLDKMAAISQMTFCIFVNEKFCILIKISLKFVPKGPIDNNQALV